MPAARARKSSTSSGRPARPRARYLGIEVAGEPVPPLTAAAWPGHLREALAAAGAGSLGFRLIRSSASRAIVEVKHASAPAAREAWNAVGRRSELAPRIRTVRTWGTLAGAKRWLGEAGRDGRQRWPRSG